MNTFYQMWGVRTPEEAQEEINRQRAAISSALNGSQPQNLEEQALLLVGKDIYEKLIRGYTEKQWGRGLYGEAMGKTMYGVAGIYHPSSSVTVRV